METFGHFFSSLLNMLGFTAEPSTESMDKSDSTSSLKEKEEKESEKENDEKQTNKNEESNETFVFIDVFENEEDKLRNSAHEIFLTSF